MNFKSSVILFAMATLSLTIVANGHTTVIELQKLLARSTANDCFTTYGKYYNFLFTKSRNDAQRCVEVLEQEKEKANTDALKKRDELDENSAQCCGSISCCSTVGSAEGALECLVKESSKAVQIMDVISTNATNHIDEFDENVRLCDKKKTACTSDAAKKLNDAISHISADIIQCMSTNNYVWKFPEDYVEFMASETY